MYSTNKKDKSSKIAYIIFMLILWILLGIFLASILLLGSGVGYIAYQGKHNPEKAWNFIGKMPPIKKLVEKQAAKAMEKHPAIFDQALQDNPHGELIRQEFEKLSPEEKIKAIQDPNTFQKIAEKHSRQEALSPLRTSKSRNKTKARQQKQARKKNRRK